jgi:endogenous inhibitor of DNA gyrase (YacG/DUF329 family)
MALLVDCPTCGKMVEWLETHKFRPFCSERCKQIDLGAWAEEKYTIPAVHSIDDPDLDSTKPQS